MKIGACVGTNVDSMRIIKAIGYDYAECHCQDLVKKPMEYIEEMKATGLPVLAANCFIGLRVVGEERDDEKIREYLAVLFERAAYLGIECLVFGSSGARRIPEGMSLEEGRAQIVDFLKRLVVPYAEKYDIKVAIEPLRPAECNAVNTVADGIEIAKKVDSPYVKVLADVKHMYEQNEDFKLLYDYKGWIIHAHTSNPDPDPSLNKKRIYPKASDKFNQLDFIEPLKEIGVEHCSIEADVIDFPADAAAAFEALKPLF